MYQCLILNSQLEAAQKLKGHKPTLTWKEQLMSAFNKGHRQNFFRLFQLLRKEEKLEFYLRVYFLIYLIHPHLTSNHKNLSIPEKQISNFREYLDTKGAQLAKTSQFLQFYALPFIKNPLQHATFKALFTKRWVTNLKEKLISYLQIQEQHMKEKVQKFHADNYKQTGTFKQLSKANQEKSLLEKRQKTSQNLQSEGQLQKRCKIYEEKQKQLQQSNEQLFKQIQKIQQRYQQLEENHQNMIETFNNYMMESQSKWLQNMRDIVSSGKQLIQIINMTNLSSNNNIERKYIKAKKKIQKYEKFASRKFQDLMSASQDISLFDKMSANDLSNYTMKSGITSKSWLPFDKNLTSHNATTYVFIYEYIPTNYFKLCRDFLRMNEEEKKIIISGMNWRLIKSKNKDIRRLYIISMIEGNFLGLYPKKAKINEHTFRDFLYDQSIMGETLQFLTSLKQDYYARIYLFQKQDFLEDLIQMIQPLLLNGDFLYLRYIMDIVQKLSVYQDYKKQMLQKQLLLYVLDILESYEVLFQNHQLIYSIIYLIMNIISTNEGLDQIEKNPNAFTILSEAFYTDWTHIKMYVLGIYYTMLGRKSLYDLAYEANLPQFIDYLLVSNQHTNNIQQLKFLEERLKNFSPSQLETLQLKDSQEEDEFEEIIENDLKNDIEIYIKGHQLLINKYSLKQKEAQQQQFAMKSIKQQFQEHFHEQNKRKNQVSQSFKNQGKNQDKQKPQIQQVKKLTTNEQPLLSNQQNLQKQVKQQGPIHPVNNYFKSPQAHPGSSISEFEQREKVVSFGKERKQNAIINQMIQSPENKQKQPNNEMVSPKVPNISNKKIEDENHKKRRKAILKQINEEIKTKRDHKQQGEDTKRKHKDPHKNIAPLGFRQKNNYPTQQDDEKLAAQILREQRSNLHLNKQLNKKNRPQLSETKVQELKAFQAQPKIRRTPPKDDYSQQQ